MTKRPRQRFVIRRLSRGAQTKLPWVLYDAERPAYVGRFATWSEARNAGPGSPNVGVLVLVWKNRVLSGLRRSARNPDDYALS